MKYIIRKVSRLTSTPYADRVTCMKARVPFGKYYTSRRKAEIDAKRLSRVNPVGFEVVEVAN